VDLKKLTERMKAKPVLLFEYPEEKAPQQRGHQYGNDTRKRQSAEPEGWPKFAHLYDLRAGRVKIFSVLRKRKTIAGKRPQKIVVWLVNISDCKFSTPKPKA
jgi:hypothetical protein